MENYLQITIIGERFTGKTTLVNRITRDRAMDQYRMTLGVTHTPYTLNFKTDAGLIPIEVLFSDMPGQYSLFPRTEPRVDALILLFSLDNMRSFDEMEKWMFRMKKMSYGPRPLVIVGNKLDLENERIVPKEQVFEFMERVLKRWRFKNHPRIEIPIKYIELSAKNSNRKVFETIIAYLAGESYKLSQYSPTKEWDYFYQNSYS